MPVELRKRKEAPPAPAPPAKKKAPAKGKKAESEKTVVEKVQDTVTEQAEAVKDAVVGETNGASAAASSGPPKVGDTIDIASFGGEIETNDGDKTTLAKLVEESKAGVVLFTYPKASTPGCKSPSFPVAYSSTNTGNYRHNTSLPLPRLLHAPYRYRLLHLRPFIRQPQGQHYLQDQAEASLHTAVRPSANPHFRYRLQEGTQGHHPGCLCCGQGGQGVGC